MINFTCVCAVLANFWYDYYNQEQTEVIFFHGNQSHCDIHRNKSTIFSCLNSECPMCNIYKIIKWLNETKKTLDICMYSLSHELLTNAIVDAHKRGVHVRVIVDEDNITSTWQFGILGIAKRVKLTKINEKILMHHKFIILDSKKILLGSMNWSTKAIRWNWENVFLTNKYQIVEPFKNEFNTLWKQFDQ